MYNVTYALVCVCECIIFNTHSTTHLVCPSPTLVLILALEGRKMYFHRYFTYYCWVETLHCQNEINFAEAKRSRLDIYSVEFLRLCLSFPETKDFSSIKMKACQTQLHFPQGN